MRSKLWVMFFALAVLLIFSEVDLHAFVIYQDVSIASSPNPVGSGARAFIGVRIILLRLILRSITALRLTN